MMLDNTADKENVGQQIWHLNSPWIHAWCLKVLFPLTAFTLGRSSGYRKRFEWASYRFVVWSKAGHIWCHWGQQKPSWQYHKCCYLQAEQRLESGFKTPPTTGHFERTNDKEWKQSMNFQLHKDQYEEVISAQYESRLFIGLEPEPELCLWWIIVYFSRVKVNLCVFL